MDCHFPIQQAAASVGTVVSPVQAEQTHNSRGHSVSISMLSRDSLDEGGSHTSTVSLGIEDSENLQLRQMASHVSSHGQAVNPSLHHSSALDVGINRQSVAYQPLQNPSNTAQTSSYDVASSTSNMAGDSIPQKCQKRPISWWWWWEIGAGLVSIASMVLLLVTLFKADNIALASWPLWIQPNSLIAVFTTVGKSAMMVPIAGCISELKWRHFLMRPSQLSHLQLIDEASRGPWGSLMVLLHIRVRAFTIWSLAIVSLVALGYDPSAQQILSFPVRDTKMTNVTAEIGMSTQYLSKAFLEDLNGTTGSFDHATQFNPDLFKMESSMIDGISGSIFQPMYSCPGDRCSWDTFTTLGMCSEHQNVTDKVQVNCTGETTDVLNCTYNFPSDPPLQPYGVEPFVMEYAQQQGPYSHSTTLFQSTGYTGFVSTPDGNTSYGAVLYTSKVTDGGTGTNLTTPPLTELSYTAWYWCSQTLHNLTATPHAIDTTARTYERLVLNDTLQDNTGALLYVYMAPSTGCQYNIDSNADMSLFEYISKLLTRQVVDVYPHAGTTFDSDSLDLSTFLYTSEIRNATANLATAITNQVRSVDPGDNANAAMFAGDVYDEETYISVNWAWLILPFAETILVVVLLGLSMALTSGRPLLKTSLIALLFYGLSGWAKGEMAESGRKAAEELESLAEHMYARLVDDGDGSLQFARV